MTTTSDLARLQQLADRADLTDLLTRRRSTFWHPQEYQPEHGGLLHGNSSF